MKYTNQKLGFPGICLMLCASIAALAGVAAAQAVATTTVQGTVYQANGAPGSGTLQLSWPAFTTAANQAVAAGRTAVTIGSDGFVSVNLAPNIGATPAGLYYTAVYHLGDGTTSTEYWVVPAAAQAALAQVRATVMPAAQAVQAVNKAYVDQSIAELVQSQVTSSGGNMTGPLYLNGDPVTSTQAATKHYVDNEFGQALSINGGAASGPLTATQLGAVYQADQFQGADFGAKVQACINALNSTYGGSCDARNFSGTLSMASNLTISKDNATINLPCATIATGSQIVVTAGTRNVTLHGCASRGTSAASGTQGGTVFLYSGSAAMIQVGDSTYAVDTLGFHLDNVAINTTSSTAGTTQAVTVWRAQELHLESLYLLGNANQAGLTLDGTGNYTGGTFEDVEISGFQTAVNAIGHQVGNAATTDWVNASTFVRLHIDCPTTNGNAIAGTTGINLAQGDGDTFTGGDVEGCATALHLGANAQNNTIVGLRNENSTYQVVADAGSAYNNWMTGGTMFTGKLTDNGTRNSFFDTFHRSFNALNGDWYGSQQDTTLTNHFRLGIGSGNERGLLNRYQTDSGYRWTMGLSDAAAGEQYYQVLDELNNVYRLSIGQYNTGQSSSNNQTVINAAGTGAVLLNGSNNAGSGGVVFGSGGANSATVATINNAGNAQFNGTLQVSGASTFLNSTTVKNQADAEIDALLWAGATAPQKESVIYKDWNGNSQWYLVKDASNNWAVNSAVGGVDSFKAYQSNNSGDTYIDAANNVGVVRVNYEPGSGSAFNVYGGSSTSLYASFNGTTGIKFPGLAAGSGRNCVQIDNSGYLSNTGSACASASVGAGTSGQIAYYPGNGSTLAGLSAIPIGSGGTGATSASSALASLGGLPLSGGTLSGPLSGSTATFSGSVQAQNVSLGSDQPTGHQACSANGCQNNLLVTAFGGAADASSGNISASWTSGSSTLTIANIGTGNNPPVAGQGIIFWSETVAPFSTEPYDASIIAVSGSGTGPYTLTINKTFTSTSGALVTWGTDNTMPSNNCAQAAYTMGNPGGKCVYGPGRWLFASTPYYVYAGASDNGGYNTPAGGTGATATCTPSGGSITSASCTITNAGNGLYPANATLVMTGSGGCANNAILCGYWQATGATNSSGQLSSVTVTHGGFGLTSAVTLTAPYVLGGDGAAATAVMSGGSIASFTGIAGGSGYPANGAGPNWYAINGAGCAQISGFGFTNMPAVQAKGTSTTNASGQVASLAITTNSSGCTGTPTIIFGDYAMNTGTIASPVWIQATNVAPVLQYAQPVHVLVPGFVSFEGNDGDSGATQLIGAWDLESVDINQPALFGGYTRSMVLRNLTLTSFIDVLDNANSNYMTMENIQFNGGIGLYTESTDLRSQFKHLSFGSFAPWVNGGTWAERTDYQNFQSGFFNPDRIEDLLSRPPSYGSVASKIDDFFANYFYHPEWSGTSSDFYETCKFPQTLNQRQTSLNLADPGHGANTMCYDGITGGVLTNYLRGNAGAGEIATIDGLNLKVGYRPIFIGDFGSFLMRNIGSEASTTLTTDPYRNAANQEGAVKIVAGIGGEIRNIAWGNGTGTVTRCIAQLGGVGAGIIDPTFRYNFANGVGACPAQLATGPEQLAPNGVQNIPGINITTGVGVTNPLKFNAWYSNANQYVGEWLGEYQGIEYQSLDGSTDLFDIQTTGISANKSLYAKSNFYLGNAALTYYANFVFNGTAARTVTIPDAATNTVQPLSSGTTGSFVQYIDSSGVQHLGSPASSYALPAATTSSLGGMKCDGSTTTCAADGTVTAVNPSTVSPDIAVCTNVAFTAASTMQDVCNLTIPASRVPYSGVYKVDAFCGAKVTASGSTASSFQPMIKFYNSANATTYQLAETATSPTTASPAYGTAADVLFSNFLLVAPASGTGFTTRGGFIESYNSGNAGGMILHGGATDIFDYLMGTPALVSSSGSNQIQIWMSTSVANTTPNAVSCTITGSLQH